MRNSLCKSMTVISIIFIPILFSCASTQQKQSEPRDAKGYYNRGCAYGEKGQYDQAISDYNKAIEIDPKSATAYNNRGIAYRQKGQNDQAISDFNKALEINPRDAWAYSSRGVAYYFKKEYDKSWEDIKKAQNLGYQFPSEFLEELRKTSGRQN